MYSFVCFLDHSDCQERRDEENTVQELQETPAVVYEEKDADVNEVQNKEDNTAPSSVYASKNPTESRINVQPEQKSVMGNALGNKEPINVGDMLSVKTVGDYKNLQCRIDSESPVCNCGSGTQGLNFHYPGNEFTRFFEAMASSRYNLITPLQKWQYENRLPVSGVTNVEEWAREVGLTDSSDDNGTPLKKQKTLMLTEPPKYAVSSSRTMITSAEDPKSPSDECNNSDSDADEDKIRKGKGKDKSA